MKYMGFKTPVILIVTAAISALSLTLAGGLVLIRTTKESISAAGWVEHTQDVLSLLQRGAQLVERIESSTRLYRVTKSDEDIHTAQRTAALLSRNATTLAVLVADNARQAPSMHAFESCSSHLDEALSSLKASDPMPTQDLIACRQSIGLMTDQEKRLFDERTRVYGHNAFLSITAGWSYVALSTVILLPLFALLLTDALKRRSRARETNRINAELARTVKALETTAFESNILVSSRDELQLCVDLDQLYDAVSRAFTQLLAGSSGAIAIINNSRHAAEIVSQWGGSGTAGLRDTFTPTECCGLRSGRERLRGVGASEIHCAHFEGDAPESYLCLPMSAHGATIGMIYISSPDGNLSDGLVERMSSVRQLTQLTAIGIATLQLRTELEHRSICDPLTELFNRSFMQSSLERELARAKRNGQASLAVLMLDVDHFKKFNDQFGHSAGDDVLKQVAGLFRRFTRAEDILCRYGGEEFTIIMPDITTQAAVARGERLRQEVAQLSQQPSNQKFELISISVGIALYPQDGTSSVELLCRADEALYRAKRAGRDRVMLSAPKSLSMEVALID